MKKHLWLSMLPLLASCGIRSPVISTFEVAGNANQRIAAVTRIISQQSAPPSPILDAFFREQRIGDGQLGPSDFSEFCMFIVGMEDLPKWRNILTATTNSPAHVAPKEPAKWWVPVEEFATLEFYNPSPLSKRSIGWIGISAKTGTIFLHSKSM